MHLVRLSSALILLVAAQAATTRVATAQLPSTPPMKMGLWETTSNTVMQGMPLNIPGQGHDLRLQSCLTAESWQRNLVNSRGQKDCVRSNESYAPGRYSTDLSCASGKATGHIEAIFDDNATSHTVAHIRMNGGQSPIEIVTKAESHFVSADCGGVDPDHPKMLH